MHYSWDALFCALIIHIYHLCLNCTQMKVLFELASKIKQFSEELREHFNKLIKSEAEHISLVVSISCIIHEECYALFMQNYDKF